MTPEQLNEIEQRANAATSGPWKGFLGSVTTAWKENGEHLVVVHGSVTAEDVREWGDDNGDFYTYDAPETLEFITHARTDVPDLIAEVRRLQAENERLKAVAIEARKSLTVTASNIRSEIKRDAVAASRWEGVPEELEKRASVIDAALETHAPAEVTHAESD